jgi:hypothetical protein
MNARNDVKRPSNQSLDARVVLAAAQLRFAARVDFLVPRWLERCATNAEVAQRWFKTDRKPTREFGMGVSQTSEFGTYRQSVRCSDTSGVEARPGVTRA